MQTSPAAAPGDAEPAPRGKILVVDDDRLVLATVVHGLAQAGFEVMDADNGDDAILMARERRPDLALLDIRMDGMSGFDVAAYLREHLHVPFMFLSAFSDEATVSQIRSLGALAYLVKPLDVAQIVPAVEAAFAQVHARQGSAAASTPAAARVQPPMSTTVAMAVGIVMHRWSLSRQAALERLDKLARQEGRTLEASCAAVVSALEQLVAAGEI